MWPLRRRLPVRCRGVVERSGTRRSPSIGPRRPRRGGRDPPLGWPLSRRPREVTMPDEPTGPAIEALMLENRVFEPSAAMRADALVSDSSLQDEAAADRNAFWARQAGELLHWE